MGRLSTDSKVKAYSSDADVQAVPHDGNHGIPLQTMSGDGDAEQARISNVIGGVAEVEAAQMVWGKHGKYFLWAA